MPHLNRDQARTACETALRQLLSEVMTHKHGPNWLTELGDPRRVAKWTRFRDNEQSNRESAGVAAVSADLLSYTDFSELVTLAKDNWDDLSDALGRKEITGALLDRAVQLRNPTAHSRDLLPFEEDLLAGIAGQIRNQVTLYMSAKDPSGNHYARIEEIIDSFGYRLEGTETLKDSNPCVVVPQRLKVGQIVTFTCRGSDAQGRPLRWRLGSTPGSGPSVEVIGDEVRFRWMVDYRHVGEQTAVHISLEPESHFHRWEGRHDGLGLFYYKVDPPEPAPGLEFPPDAAPVLLGNMPSAEVIRPSRQG